jgi:hypothetical protein
MENINETDLSFSLLQNDFYAINVRQRNNSSYFIDNDIDIQEFYIHSNSPLSMSENNSPNNSDDECDHSNIKSSQVVGISESSIKRFKTKKNVFANMNKSPSDKSFTSLQNDMTPNLNQRRIKSAPADLTSSGSMTDKEMNAAQEGRLQIFSGLNYQGFKKKQFHDIEKSLKKYYEYDNRFSNKLDILITYTKGQKNIFIQSNYLTHKKFVFLMIPAIILSATVAILSPSIQEYHWSGGFICALNIIITSILSILNYTKYELFADKYLQLANQYDKIEFALEMTNSKLVFINDEEERNKVVLEKLKEIEIRLNELKALYNIIIPEIINNIFPIICTINIFSLIKKLDIHKQDIIHKLKDVKNEIEYILYKWSNVDTNSAEQLKDKNRLLFLYDIKEKIKLELSQYANIYDSIDRLFIKEINESERYKRVYYLFCGVHKKTNINTDNMHPLLQKYLDSTLPSN